MGGAFRFGVTGLGRVAISFPRIASNAPRFTFRSKVLGITILGVPSFTSVLIDVATRQHSINKYYQLSLIDPKQNPQATDTYLTLITPVYHMVGGSNGVQGGITQRTINPLPRAGI